ncbi:MAG: DUF2953 domain-containing protein [Lachnospiraceae bacterium]|nr:DUF2953 domain-containing protein [Lachnospiraceae bacterium]
MALFLTALKIIGLILLGILVFVLALILIILFAPIHYRAEGAYDKADPGPAYVTAKAGWLLHIIRFRFLWNAEGRDVSLKLFWFKLYPKNEPEDNPPELPEGSGELPGDTPEEASDEGGSFENMPDETSDEEGSFENMPDETSDGDLSDEPGNFFENMPDEASDGDLSDEPGNFFEDMPDGSSVEGDPGEKPPKKKLADRIEALKKSIHIFKYKIRSFCDRIKTGGKNASEFLAKLEDERTKEAVRDLCVILKKLLRHIRPRKFNANILLGFEDPSITGQIYGIYWSFWDLHHGKRIRLTPDFENDCFQGDFIIKGHVILFFVLIAAIRVYFNKKIRRLIGIVKNK